MEVQLTSDQRAFARHAIETGRLATEEADLWEERERKRSLMSHRLAAQVEMDLDEIWLYVALDSGSMDSATRVIDSHHGPFSSVVQVPLRWPCTG